MNVLIADDDKTFCQLLAAEMQSAGWRVTIASDAMQTIMFALRSQPDVIVLDIQMPGGTGIQALRKLKASSKTDKIPVVVVSGSTDPSMESSVLALGAARFIPKPIDISTIGQTLIDLSGGAESRRDTKHHHR